jgi:LPXTG-motif cell wall-anchored protein
MNLSRIQDRGELVRTFRTLGLLIATATALILAPAAAAQAEPYPAEPPASSVSDSEVSEDGFIVFSGKGFLPFEEISIDIEYEGTDSTAALTDSPGGFVLAALPEQQRRALIINATAEGTFSIRLKLTELGDVTLTAVGLTSGVTVVENVTVVPAADDGDNDADDGDDDNNAGGGGDLPKTGTDGSVLTYTLYGGLSAILVGAGAIWLARTRRRTHH